MLLRPPYLSQFIDATHYGNERNGMPSNRDELSQVISNLAGEERGTRAFIRNRVKAFAEDFLDGAERKYEIAHSCHATSHYFAQEVAGQIGVAVTIGNVYFRGTNVYGVTREKIEDLIREGFNRERFVDVHVWLTTADMTVLDLTVLSSLTALGYTEAPSSSNRVLVWNEKIPGDLEFEPLLVDNDFYYKVERGVVSNA